MNNDLEKILERTDELMKQDIPTARFGNKWKEYTKEHETTDSIIDIAHYQGRKNIFLMMALEEYFK